MPALDARTVLADGIDLVNVGAAGQQPARQRRLLRKIEGRCGKRRTRSGLEALRAPARYPNRLAGGKDSKPTRPSRSILNVHGALQSLRGENHGA